MNKEYADELLEKNNKLTKQAIIIRRSYENTLIKSINHILPIDTDEDEVKINKINDFSNKFDEIITEIKNSQLDFLRIMKEIGQIPDSIKEKQGIEIIINVFEDFNSIFDLTIEDNEKVELLNEQLDFSFEIKTLEREELIDIITTKLNSMEDKIFKIIEEGSITFLDLPVEEYKNKINMLSEDGSTFPYLRCVELNNAILPFFMDIYEEYIDINNTNKNGYTVLMEYANQDDIYNVNKLLKAGVNWKMKDNKGMTAMDYANFEERGLEGGMETHYYLMKWNETHLE
jgi:FtsZ-binding cell division protein ZapB